MQQQIGDRIECKCEYNCSIAILKGCIEEKEWIIIKMLSVANALSVMVVKNVKYLVRGDG